MRATVTRISRGLVAVLFASLICLAYCDAAWGDGDLAVIDGIRISVSAFTLEMEKRSGTRPERYSDPGEREALLEEMIGNELLYRAALKAGFDKRPEIQDSIKRTVMNGYREEMLGPEIAKISVTDEEMREYFQRHQDLFKAPRMVKAAVMKIEIPAKVSDERMRHLAARAAEAREAALKLGPEVASFGGVAVKYSDDRASRYRGGDTGFIMEGDLETRWPKEVKAAIVSLKSPGEVSPVTAAEDGLYVVKLMETRESTVRSFEEVRDEVRYTIVVEKKKALETAFFSGLRNTFSPVVNKELLKTIPPPAVHKAEPPQLPAAPRRR